MKLSNSTRFVVDAAQACFGAGNYDPTLVEIAEAGIGQPLLAGSPLVQMVHRGISGAAFYFKEELGYPVLGVTSYYYRNPDPDLDVHGLGRKEPKTMEEARWALPFGGRSIAGLYRFTRNGKLGKGKILWDTYHLIEKKMRLVNEQNYQLKIQSYTSRNWLTAGQLDNLTIQDIQQQLLNA